MPGREVDLDALCASLATGFPWLAPDTLHPELVVADRWWAGLAPVLVRAFEAAGVEAALVPVLVKRARCVYADPRRWCLYEDAVPTLRLLSSLGWTHLVLSNHVPELGGISRGLGLGRYVARVFNSAESGCEPAGFRRGPGGHRRRGGGVDDRGQRGGRCGRRRVGGYPRHTRPQAE